MKPTSIEIPAILTPATLVALLWWMIFIAGIYNLIGGAKTGNRRELELGVYCFIACAILYWIVSVAIPYLLTV